MKRNQKRSTDEEVKKAREAMSGPEELLAIARAKGIKLLLHSPAREERLVLALEMAAFSLCALVEQAGVNQKKGGDRIESKLKVGKI